MLMKVIMTTITLQQISTDTNNKKPPQVIPEVVFCYIDSTHNRRSMKKDIGGRMTAPPVHVFIRAQGVLQKSPEELVITAAVKMKLLEDQDFEYLAKDVVRTFGNSGKLPTWVTTFCIEVATHKRRIVNPKPKPSRIFFM